MAASTLVSDSTEPTERSTSLAVSVIVWPTAMMMRMLALRTMFSRLFELRKTKPYSSERVSTAMPAQTTINTMNRIAENLPAMCLARFIRLPLSTGNG